MIVYYGCFEDESDIIDVCPPCSVSYAACLNFEVHHLFSGQSVLWEQSITAFIISHSLVF